MPPTIRKGQAPATLRRAQFHQRFMQPFQDPAFQAETDDADSALHDEVRNVARALAHAVGELRAGRLKPPDHGLARPRPK